ncbi:hypothetical protein DFH08DRAFT_935647 [Mycena albidolilacea]|uniref:Nephrocystin 3-like N-terminal domain-containing protein n=1 Tax=Mycena albidolilacea TaxID=1033008 RepID=A0AAD7A4Z2_9AGAR|nr:hypothetical protein DFH08DRAFT_935647 [Mycena albidolilacea]
MLSRNSGSETVLHIHGGVGGHGGGGREHGIGGAGGAEQGPHVNFRAENVSMHVAVDSDISNARQQGTGGWLLEDSCFQQWELNSGGTLWCEGIPGSGKTVLVVIDPWLLTISIRQLVFGKDITSQVQELYKQHTEKGTRPSLDNIHLALCAAITQFSKVYIVVDAVDEYPENQWHLLFNHLTEVRSTVNLMITSRPHITPIADSVALQIRVNDNDIQSYVDGYIKRSSQLSKLVKMKPELEEKLGQKCRRQWMEYETYTGVMTRIEDQDEEAREIAYSTFIWVTNAKRPLTVEEIQVALAIEPGTNQLDVNCMVDVDTILSVCAGLIIVDEEHSIYPLVYDSTVDPVVVREMELMAVEAKSETGKKEEVDEGDDEWEDVSDVPKAVKGAKKKKEKALKVFTPVSKIHCVAVHILRSEIHKKCRHLAFIRSMKVLKLYTLEFSKKSVPTKTKVLSLYKLMEVTLTALATNYKEDEPTLSAELLADQDISPTDVDAGAGSNSSTITAQNTIFAMAMDDPESHVGFTKRDGSH